MKTRRIRYVLLGLIWVIGISLVGAKENKACALKILDLRPDKKVYSIGETINWFYCYEGPLEDEQYRERWYCRKAGQEWQVLFGRLEALFEKGEYQIALQLQDNHGIWSEFCCQKIEIGSEIVCEELSYSAGKKSIGACVENLVRMDYRGYPEIPHKLRQHEEGTLILSNSPENVKEEGVLYRSFFKGEGMLFLHHIQGFADAHKRGIEVTVQNLSKTSTKIDVERKSFKGPHENVVWMGQSVLLEYLGKKDKESYIIATGDRLVLYQQNKWRQKEVISALMGLKSDGPVMIEVRVYKPGEVVRSQKELPKDVH
ncbi:MAG: hypothetical protein ACRCTE_00810, partial [Cellulosilyticaceae bacterium]